MAEVCGNRTHPGYLIPHTGFEDQETHQRLSTPIIRCRRDYISSAASLQVFHHRQTSKPASCRSARRKYSIRSSTNDDKNRKVNAENRSCQIEILYMFLKTLFNFFAVKASGKLLPSKTTLIRLRTELSISQSCLPKISMLPAPLFIRPRIALIVVLFPAPFSPINPTIAPLGTVNET